VARSVCERGFLVLLRAMVLAGLGLSCAACAGDSQSNAGFAGSPVTSALAAPAPGQMPRKTMSDRVLAAMALERVTGLKPDPARLTASN
jgi:hypothetical protein